MFLPSHAEEEGAKPRTSNLGPKSFSVAPSPNFHVHPGYKTAVIHSPQFSAKGCTSTSTSPSYGAVSTLKGAILTARHSCWPAKPTTWSTTMSSADPPVPPPTSIPSDAADRPASHRSSPPDPTLVPGFPDVTTTDDPFDTILLRLYGDERIYPRAARATGKQCMDRIALYQKEHGGTTLVVGPRLGCTRQEVFRREPRGSWQEMDWIPPRRTCSFLLSCESKLILGNMGMKGLLTLNNRTARRGPGGLARTRIQRPA